MSINSILVVCVGNICRSPMAQALIAAEFPGIQVNSAGTGALVGKKADAIAEGLMASRGIDIAAHRAQQIDRRLCQQADLILTMDRELRRSVEMHFPFATGKVYRLCESSKVDIEDPYQKSREMFVHVLSQIDIGVHFWTERIKRIQNL